MTRALREHKRKEGAHLRGRKSETETFLSTPGYSLRQVLHGAASVSMVETAEEKKRRRLEAWKKKKAQEQTVNDGNAAKQQGRGDTSTTGPPAERGVEMSVKGRVANARGSVFGGEHDKGSHAGVGASDAEMPGADDADPLDAFMEQLGAPEAMDLVEASGRDGNADKTPDAPSGMIQAGQDEDQNRNDGGEGKQRDRRRRKRQYDTSDDEDEEEAYVVEDTSDAAWAKRTLATAGGPKKLSKGEKMGNVDHDAMEYKPFRRAFYIEVPELQCMDASEVRAYREYNGIKVRGRRVPKPLRTWIQAGLPTVVVKVLKERGFEAPLPIQSQAIPVIMGGRDCLAVAKTGSGKTMSFVLPMLRHIKDQPPLAKGDGPIAMVMAPTRELVQQIGKEIKMVAKTLGMRCTPVFGGSGIASQIADLKRGSEIVVCTPGRMIDILASGNKSVSNLSRVTYLVMDEADRMFDMGFEPQISRIVSNIRPDRQTVLFSATFPKPVEKLAKEILVDPVEIQMGGRSVVNPDITQMVEIRPESERFLRLLQLLGEWNGKGKILVFVGSQDRCDMLFTDLVSSGYPCLSLHGGKDQDDRESTIADFKSDVCDLMVATSVASRGLDVKDLVLVVNYDCPNHHEEYVHRVGRTGRAGRKGTAVTFISPVNEEQYAPDLIKALKQSGAVVPKDLARMSEEFLRKKEAGLVRGHGSGFGGSGFKFDRAEEVKVMAARKAAAGIEDSLPDVESSELPAEGGDEEAVIVIPADEQRARSRARKKREEAALNAASQASQAIQDAQTKVMAAGEQHEVGGDLPSQDTSMVPEQPPPEVLDQAKAAQSIADRLIKVKARKTSLQEAALAAMKAMGEKLETPGENKPLPAAQKMDPTAVYRAELDINDFPQAARWEVTSKKVVGRLEEEYGVRIKALGVHIKPGAPLPDGERKLYLEITASDTERVRKAKSTSFASRFPALDSAPQHRVQQSSFFAPA